MGGITPKVPSLALSFLPAKNNYNNLDPKSQYPKLKTDAKIVLWVRKGKDGTDGKKTRKN
jgi:uncharacterized protein